MFKLLFLFIIFCFSVRTILLCQDEISSVENEIQKVYQQYFYQLQGNNYNVDNSDKQGILFLEVSEYVTAEIIDKQKDCYINHSMIDFPTYSYDNEMKVLNPSLFFHKKFDTTDIKLILGSEYILGENMGGGVASGLNNIDKLPAYKDDTSIYEIDSNGTVFFKFEHKYYKLKKDEKIIEVINYIKPQVKKENGFYSCKLKVTRKITFSNYGYLNKISFQ